MLLQDAPAALDRVVLAVVGRGVGQADDQAGVGGELHEAVHELGPVAVVLRAVVQVEDQRGAMREAGAHRRPPLRQPIHQAVAGHARGHGIEEAFVQRRQEQPDRRHRPRRREVVVGGGDRHAAPPPPREGAELDRGLRVQRDPQRVPGRVGGLIDGGHVRKDGVGRGDLFWGCVLATVWG